jgi:hypothetical protein
MSKGRNLKEINSGLWPNARNSQQVAAGIRGNLAALIADGEIPLEHILVACVGFKGNRLCQPKFARLMTLHPELKGCCYTYEKGLVLVGSDEAHEKMWMELISYADVVYPDPSDSVEGEEEKEDEVYCPFQ